MIDPPATALSRVERKRVQRTDEILRIASKVLAERGYHNTSLEMISEQMDLTKASLYHYFDSKDALFEACLARVAERSIERFALVDDETQPAPVRLRALVVEDLKILTKEEPELSRLFLQPFDWPEVMTSTIRRWRKMHSTVFDQVIDAGIASGDFAPRNEVIARHCMFGAINYVPVWFRSRSAELDAEVFEAVADEVLRLFIPVT